MPPVNRSLDCGLEAWVYNPANGRNITAFIVDGFDHKWVRTPGSIDLMIGAYIELAGYYPSSKDQVLKNVEWRFTGRRSTQYKFQGQGLSTNNRLANDASCGTSTDCNSLCCTSAGIVSRHKVDGPLRDN